MHTTSYKNWTGHQKGQLTVLREVPRTNETHSARLWLCQCDCGNQTTVKSNNLYQTISCGCRQGRSFGRDEKWRATFNMQYNHHRCGARRRGLVELSKPKWESLTKSPCYYCEAIDMKNIADTVCYSRVKAAHKGEDKCLYGIALNGIDRIDNNRGYEEDNVVACCFMCNSMKSDLSFEKFIRHLTTIHKYQEGLTYAPILVRNERAAIAIDHQYRHHKADAIQSNRTYLNREDWESVVFKPCHYCGQTDMRRGHTKAYMSQETRDKYLVSINGVDRIDSSLGYTLANVTPCCGTCNHMKLDYSADSFISQVDKILNHLAIHA